MSTYTSVGSRPGGGRNQRRPVEHRPRRMRLTTPYRVRCEGELANIARSHSCKYVASGWKANGTQHPLTAHRLGRPPLSPPPNRRSLQNARLVEKSCGSRSAAERILGLLAPRNILTATCPWVTSYTTVRPVHGENTATVIQYMLFVACCSRAV